MKKIDDFRLNLGKKEYVPIMIGGMGVDISTAELALEAVRLGGLGHISDAMVPAVSDKRFQTQFVQEKFQKYKYNVKNIEKVDVQFNLQQLAEATKLHVGKTVNAKQGDGAVLVNCMEKLTMNNPRDTLKVRLHSAMDAEADGITLSAGLHLSSFELASDHPRFRDVYFGIIVSSVRALKPFLKKAARVQRMPDYIIVEGPLAGGHLGFGMDWNEYQLKDIVVEVLAFLREEGLQIPVIPAGGIFTGSEAVDYLSSGSSAVQLATRFTITKECGLPPKVKQEYFKAQEQDVEVNMLSPTGYPMRMLKQSPAINSGIRPNCEALGYLLDKNGHCAYVDAYNREVAKNPEHLSVQDKTCLCTAMKNFKVWTCGHYVYRLKDTSRQLPDGSYQLLSAEHVFKDYQFSVDYEVKRPPALEISPVLDAALEKSA